MTTLFPISLLYVEDDALLREAVATLLETRFQRVITAADGVEALKIVAEDKPDIVLTDICMPKLDGLELATRLKATHSDIPVIIATAFTEVDHLLKAIELGVSGFVSKPLDYEQLFKTIDKTVQPVIQRKQIESLRNRLGNILSLKLGWSPAMRRVAEQAAMAAESSYNVMIEGEAGAGKTHLAALIHSQGEQCRAPFIVVYCPGTAAEQLEFELFGRRGKNLGKLSVAASGTVVLQQVDTVPVALQAKLARAIDDRTFLRAGDSEPVRLNARVMATVRGSAQAAHAEGRLCDALFYLMTEQVISMPPLRTLLDELPLLAGTFLAEAAEDLHRPGLMLTDDALAFMVGYPWPGNISQLKNIIRRAALCGSRRIDRDHLAPLLPAAATVLPESVPVMPPSLDFAGVEQWAIKEALQRSGGRRMQAAELLGMDYKRFKRKLEKHGLSS